MDNGFKHEGQIMNFKQYLENFDHAKNDLNKIMDYSEKLQSMINPCMDLEDWIKAKLTHAEDYLNTVLDYIKFYQPEHDESPNRMAIGDILSIHEKAKEITGIIDNVSELNDWVKAKINLAGEYMDDIFHHLDYKLAKEDDMEETGTSIPAGFFGKEMAPVMPR